MADTAAALVIQLSADFKQFQKEMRAATGAFDAEGRKIERRQAQLKKNLQNGFSGIGKYVVGGAALYGIERFVDSIVEAGGKIKDASDATRVGTDELQAWGLLAERAGTSQESFNGSLEKFSKNLGNASIQGGNAAKFYKQLGVDVKGSTTDAFYQLADAVAKVKSPQQQVALVTQALGKSAASLTPILAQGSTALRAQTAELVKSGQVIKSGAIDKIDDLGDAWSDFKRQVLATGGNALAEPLSNFTNALKDERVQSSLKTFATIMGDVAIAAAKVAKYAPIIAGIWGGAKVGRLFGPEGTIIGGLIGGVGGAGALLSLGGNQSNGATTASTGVKPKAGGSGNDLTDLLGIDANRELAGRNELSDLAKRDTKDTRDAILRANDDIRESNLNVDNTRRDAIKAQDDALLQLSQGASDYYAIQKEVIEEIAKLDISSINDRRDADLAALKERSDASEQEMADELDARKRQLAELVAQDKISPAQSAQSLADFEKQQSAQRVQQLASDAAQRVSIEQGAALQIEAINTKKNADLTQADEDYYQTKANLITLNDGIRQGLIDIGTAGLKGFGSLKDAAAQALEQIAQMILQMYVLKPLVEGLLGKTGTTGGGLLGGFIGSLFGGSSLASNTSAAIAANPLLFASGGYTGAGGVNQPAGIVHKGEVVFSQADVARLGGVGSVEALRRGMSIPTISAPAGGGGGGPTIIQQFDLRGAVVPEDLYAKMNATAAAHANAAVRRFNDKVLPSRVASLKPRQR